MADPDSSPKLSGVWGFVLLRGLIEGALLLTFLLSALYAVGPLALFIAAVLVGGSLVELAMAYRLSGHAFRNILVFVGLSGLMIAAFILYNYFFVSGKKVTLDLLVVMMGLWVAVRGFASFWLGLSIVSGTFERAVPIGAGLVGLGVGFAALTSFKPEEPAWFVRLLALYGLISLVVHLLVAFRMRRDRRRVELEAERAQHREKQKAQQGSQREEQNEVQPPTESARSEA
jgi:hypothetical protein